MVIIMPIYKFRLTAGADIHLTASNTDRINFSKTF